MTRYEKLMKQADNFLTAARNCNSSFKEYWIFCHKTFVEKAKNMTYEEAGELV